MVQLLMVSGAKLRYEYNPCDHEGFDAIKFAKREFPFVLF
jgi:hypothetical protein